MDQQASELLEQLKRAQAQIDMLREENGKLKQDVAKLRTALRRQAGEAMSTRLKDALRE